MEKIESTLKQTGEDNYLDNSQIKKIEETIKLLKMPDNNSTWDEKDFNPDTSSRALEKIFKELNSKEFNLPRFELPENRKDRKHEMEKRFKKISPDKVMEINQEYYSMHDYSSSQTNTWREERHQIFDIQEIGECINEAKKIINDRKNKIEKIQKEVENVEEVINSLEGK